jgi:hypothetical protein
MSYNVIEKAVKTTQSMKVNAGEKESFNYIPHPLESYLLSANE